MSIEQQSLIVESLRRKIQQLRNDIADSKKALEAKKVQLGQVTAIREHVRIVILRFFDDLYRKFFPYILFSCYENASSPRSLWIISGHCLIVEAERKNFTASAFPFKFSGCCSVHDFLKCSDGVSNAITAS